MSIFAKRRKQLAEQAAKKPISPPAKAPIAEKASKTAPATETPLKTPAKALSDDLPGKPLSLPVTKPIEWRNPTAFVLAERTREGSLKPITGNALKDLDEEHLAGIATASIGTLFLCLQQLFDKGTLLRLLLQDDKTFRKQLNTEALDALKEELKGECSPRKKKEIKPKPAPVKKTKAKK